MAPDATLEHLGPPPSAETALTAVAEPLRGWFQECVGSPTAAQRLAWPVLAGGKHLLLCAPTGAGKTLAAFLPALDAVLQGSPTRGVSCLYVAPLKALCNDTRRNLRNHLGGVEAYAAFEGTPLRRIPRAVLRTGDTPPRARRRLRTDPPDVLLTTPESLALLLTQTWAADLFAGLRHVVVDEVHALAVCKRGADLALSLERLAELCGESFVRVGLSATCEPVSEAARYLVGVGRPCAVAVAADNAPLDLTVEPIGPFRSPHAGFVAALVERIVPEIEAHRSTLIFTNTRGLAERLAWAVRHRRPEWDACVAVHHSALAAERRRVVERQFKRGRLRAVFSSTSLELGIDVGPVERVILCRPPGSVARLLQRVGRAGHRPGRGRSGLVLASSAAELVEAAVAAVAARAEGGLPAACEPLRLIDRPLDVLCQQLLGMAVAGPCDRERVWNLVRRAGPYRDLPRGEFDACLAYLSGRRPGDADTERPWLPPRVRWNGDAFSVRDERTVRILRTNSGSILSEETRPVVVEQTEDERRLTVGEVAEAFADRLQPGDRFLLDGRCLEFRRLDREAVVVHEVPGRPAVPRWNGDGVPQPPELARRVYLLRARAAEALRDGPQALTELLCRDYGLTGEAVELLAEHVQRQEGVSETPAASVCLVEAVRHDGGADYYLHTPLNRAGNDALARVAVLRLRRGGAAAVTSVAAELGFSVTVRGSSAFADLGPDAWRAVLAHDGFEADLRETLAESELLRERFRRVALTGLMLLQNPIGRKQRVGGRDWAERRLFERVRAGAPNFVLLRQAWREVLTACCDVTNATAYLETLPRQVLRCRWLVRPSPFVEAWTELAEAAAESVMSPAEVLRRLHAALTGESTA